MSEKRDILWAPWRLEYIKTAVKDPDGCFLCEAFEGDDDRESLLLYRAELAFCVMNLYPYNNGHLLIAPNRHVGDIQELTPEELLALNELTRFSLKWLDKAYSPHGYNVGLNLGRVAGAGLPEHLHYHVVPRWNGDVNFMPVLGFTKVVSEGLQASYDRLRQAIEDLEKG